MQVALLHDSLTRSLRFKSQITPRKQRTNNNSGLLSTSFHLQTGSNERRKRRRGRGTRSPVEGRSRQRTGKVPDRRVVRIQDQRFGDDPAQETTVDDRTGPERGRDGLLPQPPRPLPEWRQEGQRYL